MSPNLKRPHRKQRGAGLPLAIFIITVLALIVVTITQLQRGTAEMEIQDIQSTRAFYAAESGAQAALALLFPLSGTASACNASLYQHAFTTNALNSCSVSVACTEQTFGPDTYYRLVSNGTCGNGIDQSRRRIEVKAR